MKDDELFNNFDFIDDLYYKDWGGRDKDGNYSIIWWLRVIIILLLRVED